MKKTYQFDVPCVYYYEIDANTEEEARLILNKKGGIEIDGELCLESCLLYTSPSPRDGLLSRMPSSA